MFDVRGLVSQPHLMSLSFNPQVDLVAQGDSIYDIIDPADHFVMRNQLALPSPVDTSKFLL